MAFGGIVAAVLVVVLSIVVTLYSDRSRDVVHQDRATVITNYINSIKLSTDTLTVPTSSLLGTSSTSSTAQPTSEQRALAWLVYDDPLQLWPNDTDTNRFRLEQRYALLTLLLQLTYFILPNNSASSIDVNECEWRFVECETPTDDPTTTAAGQPPPPPPHVTVLDVDGLAFTTPKARLSPDLQLLTKLEHLVVAEFRLEGSLSSSFGMGWTNLKHFDVSDNALKGSLSSSFGATWTNLKHFDVSSNALEGSLPSTLGMVWTNLEYFGVANNALKGSLPLSIGTAWSNLDRLEVWNNELTGSLSSSLGLTWIKLDRFNVWNNSFTGSLSTSLGATWANLAKFDVHRNALTGTIPNLAGHWKSLIVANFEGNSFTGSMPNGFCIIGIDGFRYLTADCDKVECPCCAGCHDEIEHG